MLVTPVFAQNSGDRLLALRPQLCAEARPVANHGRSLAASGCVPRQAPALRISLSPPDDSNTTSPKAAEPGAPHFETRIDNSAETILVLLKQDHTLNKTKPIGLNITTR